MPASQLSHLAPRRCNPLQPNSLQSFQKELDERALILSNLPSLNNPLPILRLGSSPLTRRSLLAATLAGWGYWSSSSLQSPEDRQFLLPDLGPLAHDPAPRFSSRWIEHHAPLGFVHCASLSESLSRELVCVWYGGSREGARDVRIWMSTLNQSPGAECTWSLPNDIMDFRRASLGTEQFVKKIGNPLIFHDSQGRLWLLYVSIALGGWSTSSLNATYSTDGGLTWASSQRLWLSPTLNVSELVRCPAIRMRCGEVGIPIYHECAGVFPEMLWLRPGEAKIDYRKSRLCGGADWLQPSVVPTGSRSAICYLRCANESRRVGFQSTSNAGETWTRPQVLDLPNPNSAVCGVMMSDSGILLALNDSTQKRDSLSLAYSSNGQTDWKIVAKLDHTPDQKFSYPTIVRDQMGTIHLVYSWRMQKLRHISFNDAWVYQQLNQSRSTANLISNARGIEARS